MLRDLKTMWFVLPHAEISVYVKVEEQINTTLCVFPILVLLTKGLILSSCEQSGTPLWLSVKSGLVALMSGTKLADIGKRLAWRLTFNAARNGLPGAESELCWRKCSCGTELTADLVFCFARPFLGWINTNCRRQPTPSRDPRPGISDLLLSFHIFMLWP